MSEKHQTEVLVELERAIGTVILATTHKNALGEAMIGRFATNAYEMLRPTADQAVEHMSGIARKLEVKATPQQLLIVAQHCECDLRQCVDFVYTTRDQGDGVVTDEFVSAVLGTDSASDQTTVSLGGRTPKL